MYEDFDVNLTHIFILLMGHCSGMELRLFLHQDVKLGSIADLNNVQSVPNN